MIFLYWKNNQIYFGICSSISELWIKMNRTIQCLGFPKTRFKWLALFIFNKVWQALNKLLRTILSEKNSEFESSFSVNTLTLHKVWFLSIVFGQLLAHSKNYQLQTYTHTYSLSLSLFLTHTRTHTHTKSQSYAWPTLFSFLYSFTAAFSDHEVETVNPV